MRYLARLIKPPMGGVVLDLFNGSGTSGMAAILEGFAEYHGIDIDPHNLDISAGRLSWAITEKDKEQAAQADTPEQMELL